MRLRIALAAIAIAGPAFTAAPGAAAPQILALLSTDGPVPLRCVGAVCTAELSAFCLEEKRATPSSGTAYRAPANAGIVLVVTAADGSVREIDGSPFAEFASVRDMTAVRVTIDRRAIGDVERIAIRSSAATALLPAPSAHYARPHTAAEIAYAVGPLRAAGARVVDASTEAQVARALARALNALRHEDGAQWLAGSAAAAVASCEAKVAGEKARRQNTIGVLAHWTGRSIVGESSVKSCLEEAHSTLMTRLNHRFWSGELSPETPAPAAPRM